MSAPPFQVLVYGDDPVLGRRLADVARRAGLNVRDADLDRLFAPQGSVLLVAAADAAAALAALARARDAGLPAVVALGQQAPPCALLADLGACAVAADDELAPALRLASVAPDLGRRALRDGALLYLSQRLTEALAASDDVERFAAGAVEALLAATAAAGGALYVLAKKGGGLRAQGARGALPPALRLGDGAVERRLLAGEPVLLGPRHASPLAAALLGGDQCRALLAPLPHASGVQAVAALVSPYDSAFAYSAAALAQVLAPWGNALARVAAERQAATDALSDERRLLLLRAVLRRAPVPLAAYDGLGRLLAVSAALEALIGVAAGSLEGGDLDALLAGGVEALLRGAEAPPDEPLQVRLSGVTGAGIDVEAAIAPLPEAGTLGGGVAVFRDLAAQRRSQDRLARGERLRALHGMAAGVAHSINNRLSVILGRAQLALREESSAPVQADLEAILQAARQSAEMVRQLQASVSLGAAARRERVDLAALAEQALATHFGQWAEDAAERASIEVVRRLSAVPPVMGSARDLERGIANTIVNACEAMPQGGTLTVTTRVQGRWVTVEIADTGLGMDEETRRRAFDPLFTTKGPQSHGLGLSVAYGTVTRHGGEIEIDSAVGRGTTVTLRLPAAPELVAESEAGQDAPATTPRILVIDAEGALRQMLVRVLAGEGYAVSGVAEAGAGLAALAREPHALVIAEAGLPHLPPLELAAAVHRARPEVALLLLGDWDDAPREALYRRAGVAEVLYQPFDATMLVAAVARCLGAAPAR